MELAEKLHRVADKHSEDELLIDTAHRLSKVIRTISVHQLSKMNCPAGNNLALKKELFDEIAAAENVMDQLTYRLHGEGEVERNRDEKLDRMLRGIWCE